MRIPIPITAVVLGLAVAAFPPGAAAQENQLEFGRPIAWRALLEGTPYEVSGVVHDVDGRPLEGAQVELVGTQSRGLTDAEGRFRFLAPGQGDWPIRVQLLGYRPAVDTLRIRGPRRVQVMAMLETLALSVCANVVCPGRAGCDDLNIAVVDSVTGAPPDAVVTVKVEGDSLVRRHSERLSSSDGMGMNIVGSGGRIDRPGYYTIEVTASGYEPWGVEKQWLELTNPCRPHLLGGRLEARLVPVRHR
jgi:hypothetical protein